MASVSLIHKTRTLAKYTHMAELTIPLSNLLKPNRINAHTEDKTGQGTKLVHVDTTIAMLGLPFPIGPQ